jgi:hypothetical protein
MKKPVLTSTDEELPGWAVKQIRALSKGTGISFSEIRDAALGFGLYQCKAELAPVKQLLASARTLATLEPDQDELNEVDQRPQTVATNQTGPGDEIYGTLPPDADSEKGSEIGSVSGASNGSGPDPDERALSVETPPDHVGQRRDQSSEGVLDLEDVIVTNRD